MLGFLRQLITRHRETVDCRCTKCGRSLVGEMGPPGENGRDGDRGMPGLSPILALQTVDDKSVLKVIGWVRLPTVGMLGPDGIVADVTLASDLRGPRGAAGLAISPPIQHRFEHLFERYAHDYDRRPY